MTQTLTFRLFDSMPQSVLEMWEAELRLLPNIDADKERRKRIDAYLDKGYGSCFLRDNALAEIVQNALLHFDGQRYALHAWVVMPNHVHTLFTAKPGFELGKIAHSWKSFTATECNRVLNRSGIFWQREPFDRYVRDKQHFMNTVRYIENNPVKASLCFEPTEWRWSSAYFRYAQRGGPGILPA